MFDGGFDLSWHNQVYQAFVKEPVNGINVSTRLFVTVLKTNQCQQPRTPVNHRALRTFKNGYETPTAAENFKLKIITVYWKFKGTEEERKQYMMWLDI